MSNVGLEPRTSTKSDIPWYSFLGGIGPSKMNSGRRCSPGRIGSIGTFLGGGEQEQPQDSMKTLCGRRKNRHGKGREWFWKTGMPCFVLLTDNRLLLFSCDLYYCFIFCASPANLPEEGICFILFMFSHSTQAMPLA